MPTDLHIPTLGELTPSMLSIIVSAIISLVFRFIPAFSAWLDQKSPQGKQTFMLIVTLLVAVLIGAVNVVKFGISEQSVLLLLLTVYFSLTANQTTYQYIRSHESYGAPRA